MPRITVNGVALQYTDRGGEGPPLLLVHGWGGDGAEWEPHLRAWAGRRRVLVPDLRGHGRSAVPHEGYGPRDFAADLAALLGALGTGPVVAVGHSMGGQVVTALAVEHPELVRALVVADPAYGADEAELAGLPAEQRALRAEGAPWAVRFVGGAFRPGAHAALRARHETLMGAMDPGVLLRCRDGMYLAPDAFGPRPACRAYLAGRRCPVLAVYSRPAPAAWERGTVAPAGSRVEVWPECGHYLHEEEPDRLVALVDSWTAGLESPADPAR
ncbi:alpha/beta fold hydrolase [Streptomyces corynorhini]|uniref:Alpha/beta hydrolase n=1 Tax=Streptomyces corynorhini TaxID=2282652 RepID=A0A370B9G3_9ACTN|nr:alpha/beta hydrolase [Streptomyces corynorhini]RDG37019.1 alpha/beta hydrolase [Streptomyces corynorhini]